MTDIFKTVCTSEEDFEFVNMPIFPEGNKAGTQYSQVPAMIIEAMIQSWTALKETAENMQKLLRLKGITTPWKSPSCDDIQAMARTTFE